MNWELIKEILRRAEIKARARGVERPVASIRIDSNEQWSIFVMDGALPTTLLDQVDGGKGADALATLLSEVRGK